MLGYLEGSEDSTNKVFEGACFSCTGIVESAGRLVLHEPYADACHVLHIDEVADLLTILVVGVMRAEEFYLALLLDLVEGMEDNRCHTALVVFIRAEDIEELKAGPEGWCTRLLQCPYIELVL